MHPLLDEYNEKIGELSIIEGYEPEEKILEVLRISLENGKTFYANAPLKMKRQMEEYEKQLWDGVML